MITLDDYKTLLNYKTGMPLAEVRRKDSAQIINDSFTNDPTYRPVRILTQDGWKVVDAKFIQHQTQSISGDIVDWWLQFRPYEHYTIGSYVIIPADGQLQPNTYDDEYKYFADENVTTKNDSNLWMIVNKNNRDGSLRYNILRCNWKFKWVDDDRKLCDCIGAIRIANSYTSKRNSYLRVVLLASMETC